MTSHDDLWSAKLPNGDVRSGTLEQLDEAFRTGHLGPSTLVCGAHSATWIPLADALATARAVAAAPPRASVPVARTSVAAPRPSAPVPAVVPQPAAAAVNGVPEVWQVRLASGEVRSGTREQLAEALHGGHLDEHVLVLAAEAREWVPLGVVMRRSEAPAPVAFVPPAPVFVAPPVVAPPVALPVAAPVAPSPARDGRDDVWQVKLADGQVRSGTRGQLEEAFNAGHIDQAALVLAAGASEWVTLAQMMAPEPPPVAVQPAAPIVAPELAMAPPAVASPAIPSPDLTPAIPSPTTTSPVSVPEEATVASAPAAPATNGASAPPPGDVQPDLQAAWDGDGPWQVNLSSKQLKQAFYEGVLDDDAQVRAAGSDEWIRLGDARRVPSASAASSASPPDSDATPATNGAIADGDAAGASLHETA
jgi:hypothetical protein